MSVGRSVGRSVRRSVRRFTVSVAVSPHATLVVDLVLSLSLVFKNTGKVSLEIVPTIVFMKCCIYQVLLKYTFIIYTYMKIIRIII
jgi:hypothetical protein